MILTAIGVHSMADIMNYLFNMEQVIGLEFTVDVKRPRAIRSGPVR